MFDYDTLFDTVDSIDAAEGEGQDVAEAREALAVQLGRSVSSLFPQEA